VSDTDNKNGGGKPTGDAQKPPTGAPTNDPAAQRGPSPSNPPAGAVKDPAPAHPSSVTAPPKAPPPAGGPPKPPPPKNPGFVTCTIDGKEVVAKPGTNMIDAAKSVGVEIPYYCYHPRLSIAANCRICLIEASNAPKLVPACQTPLAEGQVVKTTTPKVKENQRSVMEMLLLNHPVDCAICDQAGECKLQDYYMKYDYRPSRLEGGKVLKNKRKVLGPLVVLDQERCIICTRCVRFMNEIPKEPQLGVFGRGSHERIDVFPGSQLTSNYSLNTVDVCPVGALLSRDYRFRARSWFLSAAPSVCTGCSRGCNTFADWMGQETYRYRPRENEAVNKSWMCDQGRLSYKYLNKARALVPVSGRQGAAAAGTAVAEVTRLDALQAAAKALKSAGAGKVAVLASPVASNEDLLSALSFAKLSLGAKEIFVGGRPDGAADHYLMTADKNPNRKGLELVAAGLGLALRPFADLVKGLESRQVKALYAVGCEVPSASEEAFARLVGGLDVFVAQAMNESAVTAQATVLLPASVHVEDEGSFVQLDGLIQRFRKAYPSKGEAMPHWKWAVELGRELGAKEPAHASPRDVFRTLGAQVPAFAAFNWDQASPSDREKPGINPLPTGADGRPPGYREFGAPRVRGI
jgi:NADH-quinone oxidoreductase subunit G